MKTNIGVIAKTKREAEEKLREIYYELDESIIKVVERDRIILRDGGKIIALALSQGIRGHRFHELYISRDIKYDEMYWQAIIPCLRQRSFVDGNGVYYEGGFDNWDWRYHVRYF